MKDDKMQLIPNEETLFKNLIHYDELIKHYAWLYWTSEENAKKIVDYLRRGLV